MKNHYHKAFYHNTYVRNRIDSTYTYVDPSDRFSPIQLLPRGKNRSARKALFRAYRKALRSSQFSHPYGITF